MAMTIYIDYACDFIDVLEGKRLFEVGSKGI